MDEMQAGKGDSPRNCFSPEFRQGWDKVFAKKSANEWCRELDLFIFDPDGWRGGTNEYEPKSLDEPITYKEFMIRLSYSTADGKTVQYQMNH